MNIYNQQEFEVNLNASCDTCSHVKPCGLLSTILKAVIMTKDKNPPAETLGAGFAYTYASICELYELKNPNGVENNDFT